VTANVYLIIIIFHEFQNNDHAKIFLSAFNWLFMSRTGGDRAEAARRPPVDGVVLPTARGPGFFFEARRETTDYAPH
jgi:hypothetical protein